ncbi:MAG: hypothetical protein U1E52_01015 [Geminicoccaceae bacterium]
MPVLDFPAPTLTPQDEAAILRRLGRDRHYSVQRGEDGGRAWLALLDREHRERGRITKRHGVYRVADARGHVIVATRRLEAVLEALGD